MPESIKLFGGANAKKAHKDKQRIVDLDGEWLAPRVAIRYAKASYPTLVRWAASCPALGGEGIQTRAFESAYTRRITYFLKASLDRVLAAKAARKPVPEIPGLIYIFEAARDIGVSVRTLRRMQREFGPAAQAIKKTGKAKDGRALPRTYVPCEFVEACKANRRREPVAADWISVKDAAARLNVAPTEIHNLIQAGFLKAEIGLATTKAKPRKGGVTLKYPRKATLVRRAVVEKLRAAALTPLPPTPSRAGRPLTPFRRIAEAVLGKDGAVLSEGIRPLSPPADMAASPKGGDGATTPVPNYAEKATAPSPPLKPRWDETTATLYWGNVAIREFRKHPAQNQTALIEAFHRKGWARNIPNPFIGDPRKLNFAIYQMNKGLAEKVIRFRGDGTGQGVVWELV
jgi:hypothetical protein